MLRGVLAFVLLVAEVLHYTTAAQKGLFTSPSSPFIALSVPWDFTWCCHRDTLDNGAYITTMVLASAAEPTKIQGTVSEQQANSLNDQLTARINTLSFYIVSRHRIIVKHGARSYKLFSSR